LAESLKGEFSYATQTPGGAVSLIAQGGTLSGSVGVASAVLSGSTSPATTGNIKSNLLPGGSYNLIANFPGDGFFAGSVSNTIPVTVTPENSTTSLYGLAQQAYGQQNGFNAIVTGTTGVGYPTGQVTLADNGTVFAQLTLSNQGVASMNNCPPPGAIVTPIASPLPCFTVGTHVITASYSGDGSFNPSPMPLAASQTITYVVTKGDPFIAASAAITGTGSSTLTTTLIAYLAGVSPAAVQPTGTVQFFDGATPLGQGSIVLVKNFPQASLPPMTFSQGIHTISVTYSGDNLYTSGEPQPFQLSVGVPFGWAGESYDSNDQSGTNRNLQPSRDCGTRIHGDCAHKLHLRDGPHSYRQTFRCDVQCESYVGDFHFNYNFRPSGRDHQHDHCIPAASAFPLRHSGNCVCRRLRCGPSQEAANGHAYALWSISSGSFGDDFLWWQRIEHSRPSERTAGSERHLYGLGCLPDVNPE
jgi:hypothetical protein